MIVTNLTKEVDGFTDDQNLQREGERRKGGGGWEGEGEGEGWGRGVWCGLKTFSSVWSFLYLLC